MPVTFGPLPLEVKNVFTSDALKRFESLNSEARSLLLEAADTGVRLEVVDGALPGSQSLGWRIATWAGDSGVAADVYTMQRDKVADLKDEDQPRIACVRQGIHIARMLLQVNAEASKPANVRLKLLNSLELLTDALIIVPMTIGTPQQQLVPYYTLIRKNPPPLGGYLDLATFQGYVRPIIEAWKRQGQRNLDELNSASDSRPLRTALFERLFRRHSPPTC